MHGTGRHLPRASSASRPFSRAGENCRYSSPFLMSPFHSHLRTLFFSLPHCHFSSLMFARWLFSLPRTVPEWAHVRYATTASGLPAKYRHAARAQVPLGPLLGPGVLTVGSEGAVPRPSCGAGGARVCPRARRLWPSALLSTPPPLRTRPQRRRFSGYAHELLPGRSFFKAQCRAVTVTSTHSLSLSVYS